MNTGAGAFRERARREAERYGADPWIFARELVQNARDAGATRVRFHVVDSGDEEIVVCQDDGEGMSFEHARRFLFALYASSKEGKKNQAGKFGVGFWSVLRFEPSRLEIRSRPRAGAPWGVALDGALVNVVATEPPAETGTEIVLRRPRQEPGLAPRIRDALWQSARFVGRRDHPEVPLGIEVNGQPVVGTFSLPAPSASFRRGPVKGVVALGSVPRVELFCRGLRVRAASSLEDLVSASGRHSDRSRVQFPELPGGLAPQALLESPDLELMLSRADARDTRALRRLVRRAQRELDHLIERQLAFSRPLSLAARLGHWVRERARQLSAARWHVAIAAVAVAAVIALGAALRAARSPAGVTLPEPGVAAESAAAAAPAAERRAGVSEIAAAAPGGGAVYEDLADRYRGPQVEQLGADPGPAVGLRYRPAERPLAFGVLAFAALGEDGSPVDAGVTPLRRHEDVHCQGAACVHVALPLRARGPLRLPVPTGHRVVAASLSMAGERPRLWATRDGGPVVVFSRATAAGTLRYRTSKAPDPIPAVAPAPPAQLPPALVRRARELGALPRGRAVAAVRALTRRLVAYDVSAATVARHRAALARGQGFLARALAIGAGDCDVQNALFTALLHAAGVPARLVIGYQGVGGGVLPTAHAWVEHADARGAWHAVDASTPVPGSRSIVAPTVAVAGAPALALPRALPPPASRPRALLLPVPPAAERGDRGGVRGEVRSPGQVGAGEDRRSPLTLTLAPAAGARGPEGLVVVLALVALVPLGWWLFVRRTRRDLVLDAGADVAKLLRGVLEQPAAFTRIRALFHRPLIPLADGRAISISRARELGSAGRLFHTRDRSLLARRALRAGAAVLDHASDEGRVVADALGAIDLDAWARLIDVARHEPVLDEVNRALRRHGEDWIVKAAPAVPGGIAALDLAALGARVPGLRGSRLVLVDAAGAWLADVRAHHGRRPGAAVFLVLDHLARHFNVRRGKRERLLGQSARAALLESFAP